MDLRAITNQIVPPLRGLRSLVPENSIDGNATSVALMLPKGASPVSVYRKFQTQDSRSHVVAARCGLLLSLNPFQSLNSR